MTDTKEFVIYVKVPQREKQRYELPSEDTTIRELAALVEESEGIGAQHQYLIYNGKKLKQWDQPLGDFGVKPGATILSYPQVSIMENIKVNIRLVGSGSDGNTLEVKPCFTTKLVLKLVQRHHGLSVNGLSLYHSHIRMDPKKTLHDYGVADKSTLFLVPSVPDAISPPKPAEISFEINGVKFAANVEDLLPKAASYESTVQKLLEEEENKILQSATANTVPSHEAVATAGPSGPVASKPPSSKKTDFKGLKKGFFGADNDTDESAEQQHSQSVPVPANNQAKPAVAATVAPKVVRKRKGPNEDAASKKVRGFAGMKKGFLESSSKSTTSASKPLKLTTSSPVGPNIPGARAVNLPLFSPTPPSSTSSTCEATKSSIVPTTDSSSEALSSLPSSAPLRVPSQATTTSATHSPATTTTADATATQATAPNTSKSGRCSFPSCTKKVGLTAITCRCGGKFCAHHRYADTHHCGFDYKAMERKILAEKNPLVVGSKLQRVESC